MANSEAFRTISKTLFYGGGIAGILSTDPFAYVTSGEFLPGFNYLPNALSRGFRTGDYSGLNPFGGEYIDKLNMHTTPITVDHVYQPFGFEKGFAIGMGELFLGMIVASAVLGFAGKAARKRIS